MKSVEGTPALNSIEYVSESIFSPTRESEVEPFTSIHNNQASLRNATLRSSGTRRMLVSLVFIAAVPVFAFIQGCGSSATASQISVKPPVATTALQPSAASIQVWQDLQFSVTGNTSSEPCTWQASKPSVLVSLGNGQFQGAGPGSTQVSVSCGASSATATVTVSAQQPSGPIQITSGGTYSGNWNSDDPNTPAVTIRTDQPVIIENSIVASRGTLISVTGPKAGANVTIENVTGTAKDPQVAGIQRGAFVTATNVASLIVRNCSMTGVSFGIKVAASTPSTLEIENDFANDLEDRASDGQGGFQQSRPRLGHFVLFDGVAALAGAEISWNKVVQTIGQTSTEDVINMYNSQGSPGHPIWIHDNYMEGASSPVFTNHYTGTALITDGQATNGAQPTAFVNFEANEVVATAGTGVGIAAGHDISASANRIVSCGKTNSGDWYAWGANAIVIWNYYKSSQFYNNTITGTVGGMVGPNQSDAPTAYDVWANAPDMLAPGNSASNNDFTDPCLTGGVNLQAEDDEREFWAAKISAQGELIGDQHLN